MASLITRTRRLLDELRYAQHRALELRTGMALPDPRHRARAGRRRLSELEALWSAPAASRTRSAARVPHR